MTLGAKLRELRNDLCLSQAQLASLMRASPRAIAAWEAGEAAPSAASIRHLARVLDIRADELLECELPSDLRTCHDGTCG